MALEFPSNPTNGQVFDDYFWDASIGAWRGIGSPNNLGTQVGQLRTASPITVANQAGRDALYPAPVEGNSVFRDDLGLTQTYYAAFNASTNPGGRDVAGWYNTEKNIGLRPIRPTTVTVTAGTASTNGLNVVSFANATAITVDGFISAPNRMYKIVINLLASTNNALFSRFVKNGTINTAGYYGASSYVSYNTALSGDQFRDNAANGFAGYSGIYGATIEIGLMTSSNGARYSYSCYNTDRASYSDGGYSNIAVGDITGIHLYPNTGNIGGTIAIYEMINV